LRIAVSAILATSIVAAVMFTSYLSYLPQYSVGAISVQGAQAVPKNAVADYVQSIIYDGSHNFFSRASLFLYPKAVIERDLPLEFPRVASAQVSNALLANAITVTIVERQPFALWCKDDGSCYYMDQSGFIFARAPENATSTGEYVFSGGVATSSQPIGQTFALEHTQGLVAFLQLLGESGLQPLGAQVQSDQDFTIPLSQGFSVYASFGEDPGALVSNLQLVLSTGGLSSQEQDLDYIDLRFGDKVYYKLKGQDQQQTASGE